MKLLDSNPKHCCMVATSSNLCSGTGTTTPSKPVRVTFSEQVGGSGNVAKREVRGESGESHL